ncbi:lantibiotic dehydratase [Streptomyces sp. NBC_01803]|uniref:lantibiotic dehydratase n=1 Tax=Streptomyces sp. NBC_01803 TaxID=2975946 RepID=UPI002DD8A6CD|nr:lantibiotic dehydratase [Streptomyces sp. NBC_01803]WSA44200.1 lantibiotic dehydratase [Streptomyces sp. NBC_01803]
MREAVEVASPALARQVAEILAQPQAHARRVRRAVLSVVSYLLRWQGRATPFGLFAGVAAVRLHDEPTVTWGENHRCTVRADARWLGALASRLERQPRVLERLPVIANSAAFVRGGRLVIPAQPPDGAEAVFAPLEVSVRLTRPVRAALEAARRPTPFGELAAALSDRFPAAQPEQITGLLAGLVSRHFLLTGLRAPTTVPDALGHLLAQLEAAGVDDWPEVANLLTELRTVRGELEDHGRVVMSAAGKIRAQVADRMRSVCDAVPQPLVVETRLDGRITLPEAVIREAEAAAGALLRLTAHPFGYPRWRDFHARFRQRYGPGAVVPVRDLVQTDAGLGLPAGFLGTPHGADFPPPLAERDARLLALVQQALIDGRQEITLTDTVISSLQVGDAGDVLAPPRVELAFQLHAPTVQALARGAFRLLVTAVPRPGASMAGRFAHLLPTADQRRLAASYAAPSTDGAITAQLSFPPRRQHSENVIRTGQLLPQVISLAEFREPNDGLIPLDDLAVTAGPSRLELVQISTGRRIEPRVTHALEAGRQTPPLARFLAEVTTARCAVYGGFDWGAAASLPYLPRLRYGKTVLAAARWLLTGADLPERSAGAAEWEKALETWRKRLRVPPSVVVCENELRLPLDMDHPVQRALLRARLERAGRVELREAPTLADLAWIGRAHELLVPLLHAGPRQRQAEPQAEGRPVVPGAGHVPGRAAWLYVQVFGHPGRQDEILTEHLPDLFDTWEGDVPTWWFQRHRQMTSPGTEQHLGLYLRLSGPGTYGAASAQVGAWAEDLREQGLVPHIQFATYQPETGRYGYDAAMEAAHAVFVADSAAALAQISFAISAGVPPEAVTAASLVDLVTSYAPAPAEGMAWLIDHLPQQHGPVDRRLRDAALELADLAGEWAALRARPDGKGVARAWAKRRAELGAYRQQLASQRDPWSLLPSLLHAHHVRTLGVAGDRARLTHHLARAAALRALHRAERR